MRERALVAGAGLIGMVLLWFALILDPMSAQQRLLSAELTTLQQSIQLTTLSIQETADTDPTLIAQREETRLKTQLAEINTQLAAKSAGLIPPERMVQVIHDVLSRQHGVALVSLHNSPVTHARAGRPRVRPHRRAARTFIRSRSSSKARTSTCSPTCTHWKALEWRFYWRLLELESTAYPRNRVRIELSTLSLDKDWIGV